MAGSMTAAEAVAAADEGRIVLLDVREVNEVAQTGKAKGALHIPLGLIAMRADPRSPEFVRELKADKPVVVYCAVGGRAGRAADALRSFGFPEVYNIGGLKDWVAAGGPLD